MNARTLQRSVTLPDLFVIRIGTAKGTASHEMMHERVGSTRPNTAGGGRERGGGEDERRDTYSVGARCAIRGAARSECIESCREQKDDGRSWERRKKRKLVTDSYRVAAVTAE